MSTTNIPFMKTLTKLSICKQAVRGLSTIYYFVKYSI